MPMGDQEYVGELGHAQGAGQPAWMPPQDGIFSPFEAPVAEMEHTLEFRVFIRGYGRLDHLEQTTARTLGRHLNRMATVDPTKEPPWRYCLVRADGDLVPITFDPKGDDGEHASDRVLTWGRPQRPSSGRVLAAGDLLARVISPEFVAQLGEALDEAYEQVDRSHPEWQALSDARTLVRRLLAVNYIVGDDTAAVAPLPHAAERAAEIRHATHLDEPPACGVEKYL